ncbi:MAG: GatB/YqeY domain-containing protein [Candidatus Aenigmarchaeota archaeon]|nr:GatB/YqeY domain-containing protein [Candidatus Aenigmarchaeota archaeon]
MTLKEKLDLDLREALINHNKMTCSVLRLIKGAIKNTEIEKKKELNDDEIISVLEKQAKQRKDSIEAYQKGNRQDLVEQETKELEIIKKYLPEKIGEDEIRKVVKKAISSVGAESLADMGKVMGQVMSELKGKAEGQTVNQIVKEELER